MTAAADANEALDELCTDRQEQQKQQGGSGGSGCVPAPLTEQQCLELLMACLDRGNSTLALSIFRAMSSAAATSPSSAWPQTMSSLGSVDLAANGGSSGAAAALRWPPASVQTAALLVVGLTRVLETRAAISLINSVRARGLASTEDVCFGHVVGCPQDGSKPLAVVQPQEGVKMVADSFSRWADHG